jgi:hypothetical protein
MTARLKRVLLAVAIAISHQESARADGNDLTLSVGDASFWVGQSEAAAEGCVPRGYQLMDREGGTWWGRWRLRRALTTPSDQPYDIYIETEYQRVARVYLNWSRNADVTADFFVTTLGRILGHRQDCRASSSVADCVASRSTTLHFVCGERHLTATVGWGHGGCAGTGLALW